MGLMRILIILILLALCVVSGCDVNSPPADDRVEANEPAEAEALTVEKVNAAGALSAKSYKFRLKVMSEGLAAALVEFSPEKSHPIPVNYSQVVWRVFFTSAVIIPLAIMEDQPITAFYNPYSDGIFFIRWKSGDYEKKGIEAVWGESSLALVENRLTTENDIPRYLSEKIRAETPGLPFPAHLAGFGNTIVAKIEELYPPLTKAEVIPPHSKEEGLFYLEKWTFLGFVELGNLTSEYENPKASEVFKEIANAIRNLESFDNVAPQTAVLKAKYLELIPQESRDRMEAVFALQQLGKKLVFFIDPMVPRVYIVAELSAEIDAITDMTMGTVVD